MTSGSFEKPTFALWRATHKGLAGRDAVDYAEKEHTRRSYVWIVLSEIEYDPEMTAKRQPTWFYGKHGRSTASGSIVRHWIERQRHHFLVAASSRHRTENYVVIFSMGGRFITVFCPTRCDVASSKYPISVRDGVRLLRLSELAGQDLPRVISEDALRQVVAGKTRINQKKVSTRLATTVLPRAVLLGLVAESNGQYRFPLTHEELEAELVVMNPLIGKEYQIRTTDRTVPPEAGASGVQ